MTVSPTVNGGLKLTPEDDTDWNVLSAIILDADEELAKRFAGLMDEESMWEDIVVPDLETYFSAQLEKVLKNVNEAKPEGEVIISKEDAEDWYGALNQARLGLEKKYHFGQEEEVDPLDLKDEKSQNSYLRGRFYSAVQSLILEYVLT